MKDATRDPLLESEDLSSFKGRGELESELKEKISEKDVGWAFSA